MPRSLRKDEKVAVLGSLSLFESCTKRELSGLASTLVEEDKPAGTFLTREGRHGGLMFVIVEGRAEVLAEDRDGQATVIGLLGPGDVVGELSLIDGQARSATVRAVTDVRVLGLASDDFLAFVRRSPKFVRNLLRALSLRVREADQLSPRAIRSQEPGAERLS